MSSHFPLSPIDEEDISTQPTQPPQAGKKSPPSSDVAAIWQYDSPTYNVESSISLSLMVPELPTEPIPKKRTTRRLAQLEDVDTVPEKHQEGEPTLLLSAEQFGPALPLGRVAEDFSPVQSQKLDILSSTSRELEYAIPKRRARILKESLLERLRWWLLWPGRLEFILWLGGTVLLICLTCFIILDSTFSLLTITPNGRLAFKFGAQTGGSARQVGGMPVTTLSLLNKGQILPDTSLRLQGKGFSPHASVIFFFDEARPFMQPHGGQIVVKADVHGTFVVTLVPAPASGWTIGKHLLVASEPASRRSAALGPVMVQAHQAGTKSPSDVSSAPASSLPDQTLTPSSGEP